MTADQDEIRDLKAEQVITKQDLATCLDEGAKEGIHQLFHLSWIWLLIIAIYGACAWVVPMFFPTDQYILIQATLLRIPGDVRHAGLLLTVVVLFDLISPNKVLHNATSTAISSAVVLGALLLSLAYVMTS